MSCKLLILAKERDAIYEVNTFYSFIVWTVSPGSFMFWWLWGFLLLRTHILFIAHTGSLQRFLSSLSVKRPLKDYYIRSVL